MITKSSIIRTAASALALASLASAAHAALVVTPTNDADALVGALFAPSSGLTLVGGSESLLIGSSSQQGTYSGFNLAPAVTPGKPTITAPDGVVLTSGTANFSTTGNTSNMGVNSGTGSYAPLVSLAATGGLSTTQSNANVLTFQFTVDDLTLNSVSAQFLFATEEFPTQSVTDIMGIFVNGVNYAFFPNGDLVSNQSGDPNSFFTSNPIGSGEYPLAWNGITSLFTVTGLINPGEINTLTIAISDTSDTIYDSALFFGGLKAGFTSGGGGIGDPDPDPNPVPEPGMLALFGFGALGLAAMRRRKR